jgi:5-dehydro-2-deoxygluconokinase
MEVKKTAEVISIGRIGIDFYSTEAGQSLKDVQTFLRTQGGSVSNIGVDLAKLGRRVKIITRVGKEPLGEYLIEYLKSNNVDTSGVIVDVQHNTSLAVVEVFPPASFTTLFFRNNCADLQLSLSDIPWDEIMTAKMVIISGGSLTCSPARETILNTMQKMAFRLDPKPTLVFDLDYRTVLWDSKENASLYLWQALKLADIIFANDEELEILSVIVAQDHVFENIFKGQCKLLIHKHGAKGATVYHDGGKTEISPYPSEVRSTNGAGDAFAAGFCHGLLNGLGLQECGQLGSAAGAIVVTRTGCSEAMPTLEEINTLRLKLEGGNI